MYSRLNMDKRNILELPHAVKAIYCTRTMIEFAACNCMAAIQRTTV